MACTLDKEWATRLRSLSVHFWTNVRIHFRVHLRPAASLSAFVANPAWKMASRTILLAIFFGNCLLFTGCVRPSVDRGLNSQITPPLAPTRFEEVTSRVGIRWEHNPCRTGKKLLPETVGGGGGFLDFDRDGRLDILCINDAPLPGDRGYRGSAPHLALYHQNPDGTFTDVAQSVGINFRGYGMGVAIADYDNDGWPDILITAVGKCRLYHNEQGHFVDVTARAGIEATGFCTAAAWIDVDNDGLLDLYIARYVVWSPETDLPCGPPTARQYCPPYQYRASEPTLYRNKGDGRFEEISRKSGILGRSGKTLAVVPCDINGDGWTDLYVANDTEPDLLLINHHGVFDEAGLTSGIALGADGLPTGSMGADIATPFRDERQAIAIGTFAGQELSFFVQSKPGELLFENRKSETDLAIPTRDKTTFGLAFADLNLDGWPDIIAVNGHIDDDQSMSVGTTHIAYRQPVQVFMNERNGKFVASQETGITGDIVGRGLAIGDYDNDGRPDLLVFENGGPVRLYHNITPHSGNWIGIQLEGKTGPRDGTGATVTIKGKGWSQSRFVTTARSYLCANDPRVLFGLGNDQVEEIIVRWPKGTITRFPNPPINHYIPIKATE